MALTEKYGFICNTIMCTAPSGVVVETSHLIPVKVDISFDQGLISKIVVSFSETYWDEMLSIFDQRYGANRTTERNDVPIMNYETKETRMVQKVVLQHVTKDARPSTKDRCKIQTTNFDTAIEHHDAFGPYHPRIVIQLIWKIL